MKSYLDLIPISAKVHRKHTRMTRLCIAISVFLIATIFGMADMFVESQKLQAIKSDGAWHVVFKGLDEEQMKWIGARPEVKTTSRYAVTNYRLDKDITINGAKTVICGFDESFLRLSPSIAFSEGTFPKDSHSVLITRSLQDRLGLSAGDNLTVDTPDGGREYRISGVLGDSSYLLKNDAYGIFLNTEAYLASFNGATLKEDFVFYVEFEPRCNIQSSVDSICTQLKIPRDTVSENTKLLGLLLQSSNQYISVFYLTAAILAVLVAFAGMLMILGSLNSNVAQRTQFFGLMRCLGATTKQVRRFVRIETLSWCSTAIPIGLTGSIVTVWILNGALRVISPTYFGEMPRFAVSFIGLIAGCVIGLLTVVISTQAPARRASRVSPLTAVSGNAGTIFPAKRAANTRRLRIDTALGIHHATGSKKNMILLTASFGFSIILFLNFSVGIDFMHHALTPLRPYTPDLSIISPDNACTIPAALKEKLEDMPGVKRVYGRSFAYDLPITLNGQDKKAHLVSYEAFQFGWAKDDLRQGSIESAQKGEGVLFARKPGFSASAGDTVTVSTALGPQRVTIVGIVDNVPFERNGDTGILICSEDLFYILTGERDSTILDIQLQDSSDRVAKEIRSIAGDDYTFSDQRASNHEIRAVYLSFSLFVYGFLAIVALIAAFNIINSMDMSVTARMNQYGAMRAIGTSIHQLKRMVVAETATYMLFGGVAGLVIGLPLHGYLYGQMITSRWGDVWSMPLLQFLVIAAVMLVSAVIAVAEPLRRIADMSVVDTISAQ